MLQYEEAKDLKATGGEGGQAGGLGASPLEKELRGLGYEEGRQRVSPEARPHGFASPQGRAGQVRQEVPALKDATEKWLLNIDARIKRAQRN